MKKLRLLVFASLAAAGTANAQYFQHVYGQQSRDILESGVNVFQGPQGHLMTGYTDFTGGSSVMITSANVNGAIPPFNNFYQMANSVGIINPKGRRIEEINQNTIGICGDYSQNSSTGLSDRFFYMTVTPGGIPLGVTSYNFPFAAAEAEATSMCYSPATGNVYICGFVRRVAGGQRTPVIIIANAVTRAFGGGREYPLNPAADWTAMDIVESPYPDPNTGNVDLALCGHLTLTGGTEDGCFFTVDRGTLNINIPVWTYGTAAANEGLNAIEIANNPFGNGPGFVMGGSGFNPNTGNDDSWAIKVTPTGNAVDFSTFHDYILPGNNDYGNDIVERLNTTGNYEYYLGGYVMNGLFGANDALVYKLDFTGAAFPGLSLFTYGGPGDDECRQLDYYDFPPYPYNNAGLSVYGNTANSFPLLGQSDFYLVKSYFNGVTDNTPPCNMDIQQHAWMPGPLINGGFRALNGSKMQTSPLSVINYGPMNDWQICFVQARSDGDNSRIAATAQTAIETPGYFPNPVSHDNAVVTVNFGKAAAEGEAEIELWNALGQLCWSKKASVADGQTQMEVQLGNELSGGMYHLIVKQNGTVNNYRIVVQ